MRIALTDTFKPNFENYVQWLKRGDDTMKIIKLSYALGNMGELDRCDALVLTGGGDVDPRFYNREDANGSVRDVDAKRDEFEFAAIDRALERAMPILGICRGLQVANVRFGGTLIPDLHSSGYQNHRQTGDVELRHPLHIASGTLLAHVIGGTTADVNSAHHQAAEGVGKGLRVSARSADGVIEALEWIDASAKPFLMLIQWHPERMSNFHAPASFNILQTFLSEVQQSIEGHS